MSWVEIMTLIYPRTICLAIYDKNLGFPYQESQKEFERLEKLCKDTGTKWVEFIVFDGAHEFLKDDMPLKQMTEFLLKEGVCFE